MKLTPEILSSSLSALPFLAISIALFTVGVMCIIGILLAAFTGAFQSKDGEARNRKPLVRVLAISAVALIGFGFLGIAGLDHALSTAVETVANTETTDS